MQVIRLTMVLIMLALLQGCVIAVDSGRWSDDWSARQKENAEKLATLELGQTEDDIQDGFGEPDYRDVFARNDDEFTVLYYRTHRRHHDGHTTRDETTPLVFIDGYLVGWGDSAVANATALR